MTEPCLKVERVSKKFCRSLKRSLWYGMKDLSAEMLLTNKERTKLRKHEFWALRDVSLELHRGETLGLIGANGAGKSTLLRLINGLIKPDTGRITVHGRVGALIHLGVGFNPILTGRENIYIAAAVLGMSRKKIDRRIDEIIEFAEIGDFIDAPVQSYSSGMKVRLGFSIAANLNPQILLIDEVLSVGDASFRQRCYDRINDYKRNGGAIVFVSHNSVALQAISDRVMLLDHGYVVDIGKPSEVVEKYEARALKLSRQANQHLRQSQTPDSEDDIWFTTAECYDMHGNPRSEFEFGEPFEMQLHYEASKKLPSPDFIVAVHKSGYGNTAVSLASTFWDGIRVDLTSKQGFIRCLFQDAQFSPGNYTIQVGVKAKVSGNLGRKWYTRLRKLVDFTVVPGSLRKRFPGITANWLVSMPALVLTCAWEINGQPLSGKDSHTRDSHRNKGID